MKENLIEIFRTGKHRDSSGNEREWTETDLDTIVSKFKEVGEDVAWTIGHPETNSPAFAWAKKFIRKGKSLFADMQDTTDELVDMLKKKRFKKRSIALRSDLSPRHIALLGAHPPAIKGLAEMAFSEGEFTFFEGLDFAEDYNRGAFRAIARVLSSLRDMMIEKDGVEKTNAIIGKWDIENIDSAADPRPDATATYSEPTKGAKNMSAELETKIASLEAQNKAFSEKITTLETEAAVLVAAKTATAADFAEYKKDVKKAAHEAWFAEQVDAGRQLPANKAAVLATMLILDGHEAHDFAEGEEIVKKTSLDVFKESIESAAPVMEFAEKFVSKNVSKAVKMTGTEGIKDAAAKLRAENKSMDFGESLRKARVLNPDLAIKESAEIAG